MFAGGGAKIIVTPLRKTHSSARPVRRRSCGLDVAGAPEPRRATFVPTLWPRVADPTDGTTSSPGQRGRSTLLSRLPRRDDTDAPPPPPPAAALRDPRYTRTRTHSRYAAVHRVLTSSTWRTMSLRVGGHAACLACVAAAVDWQALQSRVVWCGGVN